MNLVEEIRNNRLEMAKHLIEKALEYKKAKYLAELKKSLAAGFGREDDSDIEDEKIPLHEGRIRIIRIRIRKGKVQRRKKVSTAKGYTMRGGKLTRMTPKERRDRRMGQRRGKIKRRAKMSRTLIKRARSLRKRKAMGL